MTEKVTAKNLHQRLQEVAREAGKVDATGKDQYGKEAVSIADVENAIRDTLAQHGVITRWSYIGLDQIDKLWRAHLQITLVNADQPDDMVTDTWVDIGSNPSAAVSFAKKGYYKALFHLAQVDDDDLKPAANGRTDAPKPPATTAPPASRKANGNGQPAVPTPALASGVGDECPECKEKGLINRFGSAPLFELKPWGATLCNGRDPSKPKGYANHKPLIADPWDQTELPA